MLKASLGFMLSFGVRPRSLPGQHVTIIEFAEKHLDSEFENLIAVFDRVRRKRHQVTPIRFRHETKARSLSPSFSAWDPGHRASSRWDDHRV